jgi:hypothetical protein
MNRARSSNLYFGLWRNDLPVNRRRPMETSRALRIEYSPQAVICDRPNFAQRPYRENGPWLGLNIVRPLWLSRNELGR